MAERRPLFEDSLAAGARIGPYEVIRRIGSGGMGTVYLGIPVETCPVPMGREVAIKLLKSGDNDERRRFERESRYLQTLRHPSIVRVLDTGEDRGRLYLVMPVIAGKRLDDLVGPRLPPLAIDKAIDWMVQALEALHVAHLAGILHRDIKPGNLMLDQDGRIKLLDFGLASAPDQESRLTRDGDVVGTPAYMPPEQAAGRREELSRRSDIYGMGACLYELLTGHQPFQADNAMATLRAIIDEPLVPPSELRPGLPYDLETIVLVAMAKDQRDRYRTAEAMAGDLRRLRNGLRIRARRLPPIIQFWRLMVRNRRTVASVALVIFIVAAGATFTAMRALKSARERAVAVERATAKPWTVEFTYPGSTKQEPVWVNQPLFGEQAQTTTLPQVDGPLRLSATVEIAEDASDSQMLSVCELMIDDRDIGKGYRLRLSIGPVSDQLTLMREDRTVASRELGQLPRGMPIELSLEHVDGNLAAIIGYTPSPESDAVQIRIDFLDLVPLQGPDASGVYLMHQKGASTITQILLERQRSGELVSALATADVYRQDKRYARAQQLYQAFLDDHPESPQARDAKFRRGLCQEGLGDYTGALATFIAVAEENRESPYVLVATFHAWSCALKLNRYTEAERYFEAVRRTYDLATLAAAIPESTLRELRSDYSKRSGELAQVDPERAMALALTATELAEYLTDWPQVADNLLLAGDLDLVLGKPEAARDLFTRVNGDVRISSDRRLDALIRTGHAERLLGNPEKAADAYNQALNQAGPGRRGRIRLWLGDLAADTGDLDTARQIWGQHDPNNDATTNALLKRLTIGAAPLRESEPLALDPDAAYCSARLALMAGDTNAAAEWMVRAANQPPVQRWPGPLAKVLLGKLQDMLQKTTKPEP